MLPSTASLAIESAPPSQQWTAEDVAGNSAHLEEYFDRDRVRLVCDSHSRLVIPWDTLSRLTEWTSDPTSRTLWIDYPPSALDDIGNPVTALSVTVVELASQSGIPLVSHYCELLRSDRLRQGSGDAAYLQGVVALASALLRQMIELLLPVFSSDADLSKARFSLIDGTVASWPSAMAMFRELDHLLPDAVLCIVDGLHWLDDSNTEIYLKDLVNVLMSSRKFRILWTTSGRSSCLRDLIPTSDVVYVSTMKSTVGGLDRDMFLPGR